MSPNAKYVRVLLVLIALVCLLAFLNRTPRRVPSDSWLPSSFNPVGSGHMAFFETLQEMRWPVERWREPLSRLSAYGTGNALIITRSAAGARQEFTEQEVDLLTEWVRKGNTLVLLGALDDRFDLRDLLREVGYGLLPAKGKSMRDFLQPLEVKPENMVRIPPAAGQSGTLVLPPSDPLPAFLPPKGAALWAKDGSPYVVESPLGRGRVICGASAELLDNTFLPQGDNLAIVLALLAPGGQVPAHVFFEESHHGFSAIYEVTRLLESPGIRFAGMLALLGMMTFFGSALLRFGPVRPLQPAHGRSTMEFVDSIADLYQRADLRNEMMTDLFRQTKQRVVHRLHLPATASHELIAARLQQAFPQLPRWKKLAQRFDSRDYMNGLPPSGWLHVARDLIEIKTAMA